MHHLRQHQIALSWTLCVALVMILIAGCGQNVGADASVKVVETKPSLHVAVLLPLTGPGASGANYSQKGFELAVDEIKAHGGKIEISYEDTQTNPKTAVSIFQQLMASPSRPNVVIPQLSSVMSALDPLLTKDILTVATGVALPNVADKSRGIFNVFLDAQDLGKTAAKWAVDKGVKTACVVHVDDEYGRVSLAGFGDTFGQMTGNPPTSEPFSLLEKDFRSQAQKIVDANPDCIFVAGYGPGYMAALSHIAATEYKGIVITDWSITSPDYMQATKDYSAGFYVTTVTPSEAFLRRYSEKYNETPSLINAGFSYDALKAIWSAFEKSDGTVQGMTNAMFSGSVYPGVMPVKGVSPKGDIDIEYSVCKIVDGNLVPAQ